MAFNFFKKKEELNYPEEKASVLDQPFGNEQPMDFGPPTDLSPEAGMDNLPPLGDLPEAPIEEMPQGLPMPPMPASAKSGRFREGFVPLDRMIAPEPSRYPPMEESMSASMRPPEEMPMESQESLFAPMPKQNFGFEKPHVFVRINKYKEVMDSINELHRRIQDAKKDLDDIHGINNDEGSKLKEAAEVILKIEDILRYLETTFSSPEA